MDIKILKNRDRKTPTFANINLLGKCNVDCYFCLGKDLSKELKGLNQLNTHFLHWKNFENFINICKNDGIKKLYLTGQTADGLQYKYIIELNEYLKQLGFEIGVRTNGYLAEQKINEIKSFNGGIGYSIHSLNPQTNFKIMKRETIPNWDYILNNSGDKVRVSIVLNRYNVDEFYKLLDYLSTFEKVNYIQVRRISTDTRYELLKDDINIYENVYNEFKKNYQKFGDFYAAQQFNYKGKEVNFWRTVETSINSYNYFTDGNFSTNYFIVEGYKNCLINN